VGWKSIAPHKAISPVGLLVEFGLVISVGIRSVARKLAADPENSY